MRLWNWIAMAGLIGGMLALPARAQDCYIPATGDAYLWADGQGDVYGYSITYNTCQDPSVDVQVYAELDDAGWYALDSGTDIEYNGNDAEVDTAATVFYAGNYYEYGAYEYLECGGYSWEPASPGYSFYMAWSDAPNQVPTVTSTYPDDSGGDPTWTPGGGFYSGAYEVAFEGADLTGQIPSYYDSGCTSSTPGVPPYVVAAWQSGDSGVWTTVTVSSTLVGTCYFNASLLGVGLQVLLQGTAPPPPTISYNGSIIASSSPGVSCVSTACSVLVGQQLTLTGSPSGGTWSIPGIAWNQWSGSGGTPTALNLSSNPISLFWVAQGNFNVSYTVNGLRASVVFGVAAPTISAINGGTAGPFLDPSNASLLDAQVQLNATLNPPTGASGSISWVQIVTGFSITASGPTPPPPACSLPGTSPWLDTANPYPYATSANNSSQLKDVPNINLANLVQGITQVTRQISFTDYLMWQPQVSGTSFPVPLLTTGWSINDGATLANSTWTPNGQDTGPSQASLTTTYPTWPSTAQGASCPGIGGIGAQ